MRKINIPSESTKIVDFIRQTVQKAGFSQVVIGLSGGVDSAVAAALACKALGKENVHVVILPFGKLHTQAKENATSLIKQLQIPAHHVHEIEITSIVEELNKKLNLYSSNPDEVVDEKLTMNSSRFANAFSNNKVRLGNIAARTRMIVLFDFSKKLSALVMGTENKSEHILGYFTRFGDSASDIEPIQHLYKTEIFKLAKHLQIPESIVNQAPSANLWENQTDEGEFGFTYKQADEIICALIDEQKTEADLIKQGINQATINKVKSWIKKMEFKHQTPYII